MKQFIKCPECGSIELATVDTSTWPWNTFIHHCSKCEYVIMESDWDQMKAVSIRNPWGWLICAGIKPIENRTWPTNFRGRVLIHVGAKPIKMINPNNVFTYEQWKSLSTDQKVKLISGYLPCSAIIGSVEIVDCVINHSSIWAEKSLQVFTEEQKSPIYEETVYNWVLANPILFEKPILNVKGKLSFFIPEID